MPASRSPANGGILGPCRVHLVDATYELFRAHFAPRPPVLGRDGIPLSGVSGLVEQLLFLLREEGATHVGCATDRVIESFRNDLFPGYKSSAGHATRAPRAVPDRGGGRRSARDRPLADGRVRGRRRDRGGGRAVRRGPASRADPRLHAGQGHGAAGRGQADRALGPAARVVLRRRRRPGEVGRRARRRSPTTSPWSAIHRTAIPGCPAGAPSRRRRCWRVRHARGHPAPGMRLGGAGCRRHAGDRPGLQPARPTGTRRCCTAISPGCGRRTMASRSARSTWRSFAGTAPAGRVGGVLR